jgi:hypothetical protein
VAQKVCGRKRQLADDEREGRPYFRESDVVKNEVRDVINGDRRLTVREVADKSWFHYYDPETKQQSSQWKNCNSPPPKKPKIIKSPGKNMFILFMARKGMLLTHAVPRGQTVNYEYYSKSV